MQTEMPRNSRFRKSQALNENAGIGSEMNEERILFPKLRGHHCFACGTDNPYGLNLQFYAVGDSVCSDVTLDRYRVGWEGMAHGGIISTLLDEIMAWTIVYFKRVFFVTRKMEVRYLKPVPVETPLTLRGRFGKDMAYPRIAVRGEVLNGNGELLAHSIGEFVALGEEKLHLVPKGLKSDMQALFDRLGEK